MMTHQQIDTIYFLIGMRIAAMRQEWKITQSALSMKTQLPIGRIELGLEALSITNLYRIASVLHCPVAWLLPEKQPGSEEQP